MLYFAMIDGERRGPYKLEELADAGVRPDTYIWCKGMDDWQEARYDADICRMYRQRIFSINHPTPTPVVEEQQEADVQEGSFFSPRELPPVQEKIDTTQPPTSMLLISFLLTIFCFPFTGVIAIYYSVRTQRAWLDATRSNSEGSEELYTDKEREELRMVAHDYARMAKMWAGITFFLGIIVYALASKLML